MKSWSLQDFIVSGVFSALIFAVAFLLGTGIIVATGVPATGGVANILAAILVLVIGAKIVSKFGFGTITIGLMFTIAIPTVIGGPPGVYKVINGLLIGLVFDVIVFLGRKRSWAYIVGGSVAAVVSITSIYAALLILQLPGAQGLRPLLPVLTFIQAITGAVGSWIGLTLFEKRLKNLSFVRRLRSSIDP